MAAPDLLASSLSAENIAPLPRERWRLSKELFQDAFALAQLSGDFLTAVFGTIAAFLIASSLAVAGVPRDPLRESAALGTVLGLIVVVLMHRDGGYRSGSGLLRIQETERMLRISFQALTLLFAIKALWGRSMNVVVLLLAMVMVPAFLIVQRQIVFAIAHKMQQGGTGTRRAVVYGAGSTGRSVLSTLLHSPRLGLRPIAVIDHHAMREGKRLPAMGYRGRVIFQVQPGPVTPSLLRSLECDTLLIATRDLSSEETASAISAAHQVGSEVAVIADPPSTENWAEIIDIDGVRFATTARQSESWHSGFAKRIFDVAVSAVLLVLLAPLLLFIAALISLDSPGPSLFIQKRVGRNGKLFDIFKFRSMYVDAPMYSFSPRSSSDPRLTCMGRLLRRMSLDELPQLLNVLTGAMSLVGPRPEMPFIAERYNSRERRRLEVTPGLTGLWQLSADRAFPIHQNIEYDLYYMRNRGFFMDLAILVHTLLFAMKGGI